MNLFVSGGFVKIIAKTESDTPSAVFCDGIRRHYGVKLGHFSRPMTNQLSLEANDVFDVSNW